MPIASLLILDEKREVATRRRTILNRSSALRSPKVAEKPRLKSSKTVSATLRVEGRAREPKDLGTKKTTTSQKLLAKESVWTKTAAKPPRKARRWKTPSLPKHRGEPGRILSTRRLPKFRRRGSHHREGGKMMRMRRVQQVQRSQQVQRRKVLRRLKRWN